MPISQDMLEQQGLKRVTADEQNEDLRCKMIRGKRWGRHERGRGRKRCIYASMRHTWMAMNTHLCMGTRRCIHAGGREERDANKCKCECECEDTHTATRVRGYAHMREAESPDMPMKPRTNAARLDRRTNEKEMSDTRLDRQARKETEIEMKPKTQTEEMTQNARDEIKDAKKGQIDENEKRNARRRRDEAEDTDGYTKTSKGQKDRRMRRQWHKDRDGQARL